MKGNCKVLHSMLAFNKPSAQPITTTVCACVGTRPMCTRVVTSLCPVSFSLRVTVHFAFQTRLLPLGWRLVAPEAYNITTVVSDCCIWVVVWCCRRMRNWKKWAQTMQPAARQPQTCVQNTTPHCCHVIEVLASNYIPLLSHFLLLKAQLFVCISSSLRQKLTAIKSRHANTCPRVFLLLFALRLF